MPNIEYTEKQINDLFKGIYSGVINVYNLPKKLYKATAEVLNSGVEIEFKKVDRYLLKEIKNNIYMFSAAKTFTQVKEMQSMLTDGNKTLDFKTFKDRVKGTYTTYNEAYLESEYITAITSAHNAINFREALEDKKLFTQLRYTAIMDQHTSEVCKMLNGTIANTDDKFWHSNSPPKHFRCRCHLEKISKYDEVKPYSKERLAEVSKFSDENTQPVFKTNSGITKKIFDKSHPYFNVPKKYKSWAKKNFGLEIPE